MITEIIVGTMHAQTQEEFEQIKAKVKEANIEAYSHVAYNDEARIVTVTTTRQIEKL